MTNDTTTAETRRVAQAMLDAITKGDVDAMNALMAPELTFWMPGEGHTPIGGVFHGPEGFTAAAMQVFEQLSEPVVLTVKNFIVGGDWAVVEATGSSRTKKGAPYANTYCFMWRVAGGKIVEMKEYHDTVLVNEVLFA